MIHVQVKTFREKVGKYASPARAPGLRCLGVWHGIQGFVAGEMILVFACRGFAKLRQPEQAGVRWQLRNVAKVVQPATSHLRSKIKQTFSICLMFSCTRLLARFHQVEGTGLKLKVCFDVRLAVLP